MQKYLKNFQKALVNNLPDKDTISIFSITKKSQIGFINFIYDLHEGFGNLRTVDAKKGLIEFWIPPRLFPQAFKLLLYLSKKAQLKIIKSPYQYCLVK